MSLLVANEIGGQTDFLNQLEHISKLKLSTVRDSIALLAFSAPAPSLFTDPGSGFFGREESAFSKFKTWKTWKENGKELIQEKVAIVKIGLMEAVKSYVDKESPAHPKMMLSIVESCSALHALCDFVSSETESLEGFGMPMDKAFRLTTRLLTAFFFKCSQARVGVLDSFGTMDLVNLAATVWFGVAKTLDITSDFAKYEYKNHPEIAGEYIKFIVQNTNSSEVSTFKATTDSLEKSLKATEKKVDSALKAASTSSSKATAIEKDLAKLDTRVKRLE